MKAAVVDLLAGPEAARDQERIHCGTVRERVVRHNREAGLRLHRAHRICDQKGVKLGVKAARYREHAIGCREVDNLGVLEDVDPKSEACDLQHISPPEQPVAAKRPYSAGMTGFARSRGSSAVTGVSVWVPLVPDRTELPDLLTRFRGQFGPTT